MNDNGHIKRKRCTCSSGVPQLARDAIAVLEFQGYDVRKVELACKTCGGDYYVMCSRQKECGVRQKVR